MDKNTIKIQLDIFGNPFIIDACETDGSKIRLSTKEYMIEEVKNCGYKDLFDSITKEGIYKVFAKNDDYPDFIQIK